MSIRTQHNGLTLYLFRCDSEARDAAAIARIPVDETTEIAGKGWVYRSGNQWHDEDGPIPESVISVSAKGGKQ